MEDLQIARKLIKLVKNTYNRVAPKLQINGKRSPIFNIKKGIKQGDSLSPVLFILVMDKITKTIIREFSLLKLHFS